MLIPVPNAVAAAICFAVGIPAIFRANMLAFAIVREVNLKRPKDAQESALGWYPQKTLRILGKYRELYPDGRLHVRAGLATAIAFLAMAGVMASLSF